MNNIYYHATKSVIATGSVPDGYFGDSADVDFAFVDGKILTITKLGCFNTGLPDANDKAEAIFLLKNHPIAKKFTIKE